LRYRNSYIADGMVAANGDFWFIRAAKRSAVMRIRPDGRVVSYPAPPEPDGSVIAVTHDGTVWIGASELVRMNPEGKYQTIRRPGGWDYVNSIVAAPDGAVWLLFNSHAARLPPDPCLSRRRIAVHLHSRRRDPIRYVIAHIPGQPTRRIRGRNPTVPVDLHGYLSGTVHVTLKIRTTNARTTQRRAYRTCAGSG
jgi:hypothetical protein